MRDKVAMDNYLIEAKNARGSVRDDSALPVKNLMEKFTAKDAQDIRLQASFKLNLDVCSVEDYLTFLQGLNVGWHSRSNNESEISSLVNSVSFDNLLSTNMKGETSRLYITNILYKLETSITSLCTELGYLDSERKAEMEKRICPRVGKAKLLLGRLTIVKRKIMNAFQKGFMAPLRK